ncbi:hypothetical protein SLS61_000402 [Didymella pomorum]
MALGDNGQPTGNVSTTPRSLKFQYGTKFPGGTPNTTLAVDLNGAYYLKDYTLHTFYNYSNPEAPVAGSFSPIADLKRENSTLVLIYVGSNSVAVYLGNLPLPANIDFGMFSGANGMQRTILRLLATSSYVFNMATVPTDLLAGSLENPNREEGLPDDQWIRELTRWQRQILASLQVAFIDYAIGPEHRDTAAGSHIAPENEFEKRLCKMQKMRKSGDVVNINVFGLSFIIALSVTLALLDIFILRITIYLSRFRRALGPRIDRWIQDGVWQLQRRAYEGEGYRGWTDLEADIPLTHERKLKDLPILWVPGKSPTLANLDFGLRDPAGLLDRRVRLG